MTLAPLLPPLATIDAERATRAEQSLASFVRYAWPVLEPGRAFLSNWHMDLLCEYLEAVSAGQLTRLIINVPPRSLKSTIVTIDWPVWTWLRNPATRWLFASYSQSLSEEHSLKRRTLIQSEWYQAHWSDRYSLAGDRNQVGEFKNDHQGHMTATSIKGTATGKGGDYVVVDDPHNPKEAESDAERTTALRNFDLTFSTRLNDPKTGAIVIVMQRLHEGDLTGHCLTKGGYTHLSLPMRAEAPTRHVFPVSGRVVDRAPGDLLHPARWGAPEVAALETALGPYGAAGQLQQRPAPLEGGLFKTHWWRFWHWPDAPLPPVPVPRADGSLALCPCEPLPAKRNPDTGAWELQLDRQIQSWDMTFKDAKGSDYVVGQVWGSKQADRYLLDQVRERMDFDTTCTAVTAQATKWPVASPRLIEDKANGPAVISTLRRKVSGLRAVEPRGSKYARAHATVPEVASGNNYLPHPDLAPWVPAFILEHATFPNGAHDDQVDARSQAADYLSVAAPPHDYGEEALY